MTGKAILFSLLVLGCVCLALGNPRGGRPSRAPIPFRAACLVVNTTSSTTLKEIGTCPGDAACDVGPISVLDCNDNVLEVTFCGVPVSTSGLGPRRFPPVLAAACSVVGGDGEERERPCFDGTCTVGPVSVTFQEKDLTLMFCQPSFSNGCPPEREE